MRLSERLTPPGGWKYKQGDYWILGYSRKDLIDTLKLHRDSNGIPLGNVEKDIEDQLCQLHPSFIINK